MFDRPPPVPQARGPLSAALFQRLTGPPGPIDELPDADDGPLDGDDFHLALYTLYELHYRGLAEVDDAWEWHPELIRVTAELERQFEAALRADVGPLPVIHARAMAVTLRRHGEP